MNNYIGIDLGTTNSAICSYNGVESRIWKSPEQNDVTPSAIFIDKRGNKYVGLRAYNSAPWQPDNSASLFKRLMGTNTTIKMPAVNLTLTPQECSAEVLKVLFGYLPEEIRNDPNTGTVITVPTAFNQMQKEATLEAANMAQIGMVALMQEPVAAVMSAIQATKREGAFLIYDLGGGTLDIAIAESIAGRVNLMSHSGIAMCGGRDFDKIIMEHIVTEWLVENFDLPIDFSNDPNYMVLNRKSLWEIERAKIELSSREEAQIILSEEDMRCKDQSEQEIYLDIKIDRNDYDLLISEKIFETVATAKAAIVKAGLTSNDLDSVVFIGGPTQYKPLRDKVVTELGIPGNIDVNPMTAVAEGASLFAESIDWSTQNRTKKVNRGSITSCGSIDLKLNYTKRTANSSAQIVIELKGEMEIGSAVQIDSKDTGWSSGLFPLEDGASSELPLAKRGENTFIVSVFDPMGGKIAIESDTLIIAKTAATVDAIPASHSIGLEALDKIGGQPTLLWLVKSGEPLPKKDKIDVKAGESLKAGDYRSLNFKLWEGDNEHIIHDNRPIGLLKIAGSDFDDGVIPAGGSLIFHYEVMDSGIINIEVDIPDVKGVRSGSFYSWQGGASGGLDYEDSSTIKYILEEGQSTLNRIDEIADVIDDDLVSHASEKATRAISLDSNVKDPETVKAAHDEILEAKRMLSEIRIKHLKETRKIELDQAANFFDDIVREYAKPSESAAFDALVKTADGSIKRNDNRFESHLEALWAKITGILWRQDWFIIERFTACSETPYLFADRILYEELIQQGKEFIQNDNIDSLRDILVQLVKMQIGGSSESDYNAMVNIVRG